MFTGRETYDTRELAQDKLDNVKKLLAQGQSPARLRERGRETFGVVAAQWLASRHDLKPRTRAEYENFLSPGLTAAMTGVPTTPAHRRRVAG
jgi:hypothetical protein